MNDEVYQVFGAALSAPAAGAAGQMDGGAPRADSVPTTEPMQRLAARLMREFRVNADHRRASGVDRRLNKALLAQTCSFTPEQQEKMRRAGISEDVYSPITYTKTRAAKALLVDIFNNSGEWPFTVKMTPDSELPRKVEEAAMESVQIDVSRIMLALQSAGVESLTPEGEALFGQLMRDALSVRYDEIRNYKESVARTRGQRLEKKIQDYFTHGGFIDAFQDYVNYICVYGTGLMVGPIPRVVRVNEHYESNGVGKIRHAYKKIPTYEAVNPCDCYPAPNAKDAGDGTLCIRVKFTGGDLWRYSLKVGNAKSDRADGWQRHTIRAFLDLHRSGDVRLDEQPFDAIRRRAERNGTVNPDDCTYEGIRCFASLRGAELMDIGLTKNSDGKALDYEKFYEVEAIVLGGFVVYCRILDDLVGRPVVKGVFYELPGSWWGESVADKVAMCQNVMNNAIKALMQNMAAASGPSYWMNDVSRYIDRDGSGFKIKPHKLYTFQHSLTGNTGAPMGVLQIPSNASELLAVWERMKTQADDDSGIPAYTYGQASGNSGAMRTAQGLQIFTEAASRGMKMVVTTTDRLVIRRLVKMTADYILVHEDDPELRGDCEVLPAGIMGKILKAQQEQGRTQMLQIVASNPTLANIVGVKGLTALLRPAIQDLAINPDDVLPSEERVRELEKLNFLLQVAQIQRGAPQGAPPAAPGGGGAQGAEAAPPGAGVEAPSFGGVDERRAAA